MDILKIYQAAFDRLGVREVSQQLGLPEGICHRFYKRIAKPGYDNCQRIVDLWGETLPPIQEDGAEMKMEYDADGILNASYCPPEWGKKKKAWDGRDVCLCLAVYNDVPQAHYFNMLSLVAKYKQGIQIQFRGEDSMITRSRNHLAKRFMRDTDATWSIWFDSDMIFPHGYAGHYGQITGMGKRVAQKYLNFHVIERLISHGRTVVGGCYWDRRGSGKLIAGGGGSITHPIPSDTLHPIGFIGTGCLAVHRQVFVDISKKFPETMSEESLGNECGFFTNIQTPQRMLGEDESFAKRATDAGHPTFLDLAVLCGHLGSGNIHALPIHGSKI